MVNQNLMSALPDADTWEADVSALQLYEDASGNPLKLGHGASGTVTVQTP